MTRVTLCLMLTFQASYPSPAQIYRKNSYLLTLKGKLELPDISFPVSNYADP